MSSPLSALNCFGTAFGPTNNHLLSVGDARFLQSEICRFPCDLDYSFVCGSWCTCTLSGNKPFAVFWLNNFDITITYYEICVHFCSLVFWGGTAAILNVHWISLKLNSFSGATPGICVIGGPSRSLPFLSLSSLPPLPLEVGSLTDLSTPDRLASRLLTKICAFISATV